MSKNIILYCLPLLWLFACTSDAPTPPPKIVAADSLKTPKPIETTSEGLMLTVATAVAIVRTTGDIAAPEIQRFKKGDTLLFANQISENTLSMRLEGVQYDEPWLRVWLPARPNEESRIGWVYGGSVQFIDLHNEQIRELVVDRRIRSVLGEKWLNPIHAYRKGVQQIQTAVAFEMMWARSENLRDSLQNIINAITTQQIRNNDTIPNFFWLNDVLDNSFLLHWIAEKQQYYLWRDLRYWQQKTLFTAEDSDDDFIRTQLMAYQQDSIEFLVPDWCLYLDNNIYSMLGSGIHLGVLDSIEISLGRDTLFRTYYLGLKDEVVADIVNNPYFWRAAIDAQTEIDTILSRPHSLTLSRSDRIALQARHTQLANPELHKLRTFIMEQGLQ
jgi:hypothetical protein